MYVEGLNGRRQPQRFSIDPRTVAKMLAFSVPPRHPCSSRSRSKIRFPLQAKSYLLLGFYSSATGLSGRFTEDFFFGAYRAFGASLVQVRPASEPAIEQGKHRRHKREHAANRYWRFESISLRHRVAISGAYPLDTQNYPPCGTSLGCATGHE